LVGHFSPNGFESLAQCVALSRLEPVEPSAQSNTDGRIGSIRTRSGAEHQTAVGRALYTVEKAARSHHLLHRLRRRQESYACGRQHHGGHGTGTDQ
jgi:hypothetical protein